jgi:hypothetical protein
LLLSACKHAGGGYHLPQKEMQSLLLDINIAEAYSAMEKDSVYKGGGKNIDSLAIFYKDIFAHYNITQAQFDQSLTWYKSNPDELDSIYNNNLKILSRWQAKAGTRPVNLSTHPPLQTDSLARRDSMAHTDSLYKRSIPFLRRKRMDSIIAARRKSAAAMPKNSSPR